MADKNFGEKLVSYGTLTVLDAGLGLTDPHGIMTVLMPSPLLMPKAAKKSTKGLYVTSGGLVRSDADEQLADFECLILNKSAPTYARGVTMLRWKYHAGSIVMHQGSQKDMKRNVWRWTRTVREQVRTWFANADHATGEMVWGALVLSGAFNGGPQNGPPLTMSRRTADTFLKLFFSACFNCGMEWRSL